MQSTIALIVAATVSVADSNATDIGRRLGQYKTTMGHAKAAVAASSIAEAKVSSETRRITRGLGAFAGVDFPCDRDRDAFVGAPWSRGACLLKCGPGSTGTRPRCGHAISVCERLSQCSTIDINVEGSVATLKTESPLSARTSRVKDVSVTHKLGDRAVGKDGPCSSSDGRAKAVRLSGPAHHLATESCIFDCPQLNCTAGVSECFESPTCIGVDLSFQVEGHSAIARLRYGAAPPSGVVVGD